MIYSANNGCDMAGYDTTIIVPVYNGARFLPDLLDSILGQSSGNWRCICVDDGSSDDSPATLARYAASDSRFTIITQGNAGCGAARNAALGKVASDFVMFADQDDLLHPKAVETAVAAMRKSGADCLLFGFSRFLGKPVFEDLGEIPDPVPAGRNGTSLVTGKRGSWPIFVWRHIFRTQAVRDVPFPPISGGEDQAWISELSWRALKWASIPQRLYLNRKDRSSRSRGVSRAYVDNVFASYDWIRDRSRLYGIDPIWTRRFIRHMKFMFRLSCAYRRLRSLVHC